MIMFYKELGGYWAYVFDRATWLDAVIESHPLLLIRVFPRAQDVLVAREVGTLIQHPAATLHFDGVAAAEVGAQVRAVRAALIAAALEVLIFKEYNLDDGK